MRTALLLASVLAVPISGWATNIVLNPGFEDAQFSPWVANFWELSDFGPHTGLQRAGTGCSGPTCIIPGAAAAVLYQDLVTQPGQTYTLSFSAFADAAGGPVKPIELKVFFGGSEVFDIKDMAEGTYVSFSAAVVAGGTGQRLEFFGRCDPCILRLDDVGLVAAIPEPSSWLLMGLGLCALLGARQRYRL